MQAIATAELPSRISHEKVLVVFGGLPPKKREDVAAILRRLARELVPEANP